MRTRPRISTSDIHFMISNMVSAVRADATEVPMSKHKSSSSTVYPLHDGKVHPNFENNIKIFFGKNFVPSTTTRKIRWIHRWNSSVTWPLDLQYGVSYRWSIWTDRLSRTVFEILVFKVIGVTSLTFGVTWRHRSCDHRIPNVWFPIGSQYELTMYLARLSRYWASKISGSRLWPFGVTWRHLSHDHWIRNMRFPIGGLLEATVYLARFLRYSASNVTTLTFRGSAHVKGQKVDCACLVLRDL